MAAFANLPNQENDNEKMQSDSHCGLDLQRLCAKP